MNNKPIQMNEWQSTDNLVLGRKMPYVKHLIFLLKHKLLHQILLLLKDISFQSNINIS